MNTPKPIIDAVFPDEVTIGEYRLRPLTINHLLLLEKINSPILLSEEEQKAAGAPKADALDAIRALYIVTRTSEELQSLYTGFNRERFESAVWKFSDTLPARTLALIGPGLGAMLRAGTSTMIGGGDTDSGNEAEEEDGKKKRPPSKTSSARPKAADSASR